MTFLRTKLIPALVVALLATVPAGCRLFSGSGPPSKVDPEQVPSAITEAEKALVAGDTETALAWARAAMRARGLPTEERVQVQALLERVAALRIEELAFEHRDAEALADLYELELPRQLAVSAGVEAARIWVEEGKSKKAYRFLKEIDERYPLHHERYASAGMLVDIGMDLIEQDKRFLWFSSTKDDGTAVLEYVILNAPWEPRCDEAYFKLAEVYESEKRWTLAAERQEDLILYHPQSALRPYAQARVPHLQLKALDSPEYDRSLQQRARRELEAWLEHFGGVPGIPEDLQRAVRIDLTDCLLRLSRADLDIARFYHRVDNAYGAREYAERALEEAMLAADEKHVQQAQKLLAKLPPRPEIPTPGAQAPLEPAADDADTRPAPEGS